MRPKFSAGTSQFITTCDDIAWTSRQQRCTGLPSINPLEPLILTSASIASRSMLHRIGEVTPQQRPGLQAHAGVVLASGFERPPRQQLRRVDLGCDLGNA